jgi:NosR/NirI family transcriptional regulator, nitrous oxide reductase regulator
MEARMVARQGWRLLAIVAALAIAAASQCLARDARIGEDTLTLAAVPKSVEVGVRDSKFPVWPLLQGRDIVGYLFRTDDLVDIPGFAGTPINLLIAMDSQGVFMDVRLIHQNEPVFVGGIGTDPLLAFLEQYKGKSIRSNIKVAAPHQPVDKEGGINTYIDGISKASASVRIINETILSAAIKVAREKMADQLPREAPQVRRDVTHKMSWQQLLDTGYVRHFRLTNGTVEAAFAGTRFAGADAELVEKPDQPFIDLYFAQVNVPSIGRNILADETWNRLGVKLEDAKEAIIVMSTGPRSFRGDDFVPGAVPDTLSIRQGDFPINLRNQVIDIGLQPGLPKFSEAEIYLIDRRSGFDPAAPWQLTLRVPRSRGYFLEEAISRDFAVNYEALPADLFVWPSKNPEQPWLAAWKSRQAEIAVLVASLLVLSVGLARHRLLTGRPGLLAWARPLFLAFVLVFIGWYAQGQLSIVTVLGLVKMVRAGGNLSFLLYDPISLLLWIYVIATLVIWGRGAFCGWLCPFGALQELIAKAAALCRLRPRPLGERTQRRLSLLKYGVLVVLVGGSLVAPDSAERLAEFEPFKTAITLAFRRSWPYVAYALVLAAGSALVYKGFCRFLCPLGALLALPVGLRHYSWLPRRSECGSLCQLCRKRCEYDAIAPDGSIRYADCVQCLDCIAILHDPARCVPLRLERQGKPLRPIANSPVTKSPGAKSCV